MAMELNIQNNHPPPLHTHENLRRAYVNRVFAGVYACAILTLLYNHTNHLLTTTPTTVSSFLISSSIFIADIILAFMWATTTSFRLRPIHRKEFLKNLVHVTKPRDYPPLDVFICTADPYKEPPMGVVNTALSVMAYDYPTEKVSVYVSDDGGSEPTLFAFMEAAKFARHWLPFCREEKIEERCPEVYFGSGQSRWSSDKLKIKAMYENMKVRVENVVKHGKVSDEYIDDDQEREAFNKWSHKFTRQDHPTVIQVLLESKEDRDITGNFMPDLIYVSRQKCRTLPHNFKAGALNVLVRVSAVMTNAPIILTLDCDMYSNDPTTPQRMLCYFMDPSATSNLGFVQFPQRFHGINKNDTYACEHKRLFHVDPIGMDGLNGPAHVGTGCFFARRAFFGGPSKMVSLDTAELSPENVVKKPIKAHEILELAYHLASASYEKNTMWGHKMGFRYGSLVEDYFTGYSLHCEGWKSIFCNPKKEAFLGDIPINLEDVLSQNKRWSVGLLEVAFSKYSPITFGVRSMGLLMGLCYAHFAFWPIWSIPILTYATLPQLALLHGISIFPKVSDPWFLLYVYLFIGSYIQDFLDFYLSGGTVQRWWSDQRMWMIRGASSYLFGFIEFLLKSLGVSMHGFNITSKVVDEEQNKRYEKGIFEFSVASPMFLTLTIAAMINLATVLCGFVHVFRGGDVEGLFVQIFIACFVVLNCLPIYEAILLRSDQGRMPTKITLISSFVALALYKGASLFV